MTPQKDSKTGKFLKTPQGKKPSKMLRMEKALGIKFEEDYKNLYLNGDWGQKRFAAKWNHSRNAIFANNLRDGRRSWVQMLNLPKKNGCIYSQNEPKLEIGCERCGKSISLDNAHWVENKKKGSNNSYNIAKLCPNCHRALDRDDARTTEDVRAVLLYRVCKSIIEKGGDKEQIKKELIEKITPIIIHRKRH